MRVNRHVFILGASPNPRPGKADNKLNMNDKYKLKMTHTSMILMPQIGSEQFGCTPTICIG